VESRRYEGGGIYRPVWLVSAPLLHFQPDGVFVPARVTGSVAPTGATPAEGLRAPAVIDAQAMLRNFASVSGGVAMHLSIYLHKHGGGLMWGGVFAQTPSGAGVAVSFAVRDQSGKLVAHGSAPIGNAAAQSDGGTTCGT
jgi:hypothetical protein